MNKLNMKKMVVIALILITSIAIYGCAKKVEGVVAEVDGMQITAEEFNGDFQVFKNLYERELGEGALKQVGQDGKTLEENLKENIIEKLIMEKLIAKETEKLNIEVTDEEVQQQMEEYINSMGGQENFDEFLASNDLEKEFLEANMRKELIVDKHKEYVLNNTTVTDEEAENFFNTNKDDLVILKASHILVGSEEEGKKILERLESGEEFATLATLESLDSVSAARGGDLGEFTKGNMIAEFENAAFALKKGEISELVKTEVGYHIIYLEDRKDTFEELKDDIIGLLKEQQYVEDVQSIREKANVNKF